MGDWVPALDASRRRVDRVPAAVPPDVAGVAAGQGSTNCWVDRQAMAAPASFVRQEVWSFCCTADGAPVIKHVALSHFRCGSRQFGQHQSNQPAGTV